MPSGEIEERVFEAGGVAAAVRSAAEWRRQPTGKAVADLRLIEGGRIGDGTATRAPGRRVARVGRAGYWTSPGSSQARCAPGTSRPSAPMCSGRPPQLPELPLSAHEGLLGKRSALLDARIPSGVTRLHELLHAADVLVHGYRPHALSRYGIKSCHRR